MKRFERCVEDFTCENCGTEVKGDGYTDHCPNCLFSKHVDVNPGDRQSQCQGPMKPVRVETKGSEYIIHYLCQKCSYAHRNKASDNDDFNAILKVARNQ